MASFEQFLSESHIEHNSPLLGATLFEDASAPIANAVSDNRWQLAAAAMAIGIVAVSRGKGAQLLKDAFATDTAAAKAGAKALEASASNSRGSAVLMTTTPSGRSAAAMESRMLSASHGSAPVGEATSAAGARSGGTANLEFAAGKVSAPTADAVGGARSTAEVTQGVGSAEQLAQIEARQLVTTAAELSKREVASTQLAIGYPKTFDLGQVQKVSDAIKGGDVTAIGSAVDDIFRPNTYAARHRFYGG